MSSEYPPVYNPDDEDNQENFDLTKYPLRPDSDGGQGPRVHGADAPGLEQGDDSELPESVEEKKTSVLARVGSFIGHTALHTPIVGGQLRSAREMVFTHRPRQEPVSQETRDAIEQKNAAKKAAQTQRATEDRTLIALVTSHRALEAKGKPVPADEQQQLVALARRVIKLGHENRAEARRILMAAGVSSAEMQRLVYGVAYSEPSPAEVQAAQRQSDFVEQRRRQQQARAEADDEKNRLAREAAERRELREAELHRTRVEGETARTQAAQKAEAERIRILAEESAHRRAQLERQTALMETAYREARERTQAEAQQPDTEAEPGATAVHDDASDEESTQEAHTTVADDNIQDGEFREEGAENTAQDTAGETAAESAQSETQRRYPLPREDEPGSQEPK